jgi:manganese transport protein
MLLIRKAVAQQGTCAYNVAAAGFAAHPHPLEASMPGSASDRSTVHQAVQVLDGAPRRRGLRRLLPFLGPAFIAAVAYIDPGNFATNIAGGARFGYTLLWVILISNLMAMLIQTLSAKLGIVTGRNLAEWCREVFPRPVVYGMWVLMELVAMATDLAEFLGAALGFTLLFGWPMWFSGLAAAVATFLLLVLERYGFRPLERVITALVGVIAVCYVLELWLAPVRWSQAAAAAVLPRFASGAGLTDSVVLAAGILGATVMPHVIFLHSALTQGRIRVEDPAQQRRLVRFEVVDIVAAMGLAGFVNAAMLILSAATFFDTGLVQDGRLEQAYRSLQDLLGPWARYAFGVSLLASGLSSSAVGTMSGQVIMQGFLKFHIPVWVRRLVTMSPALVVIFLGYDPTHTLVISQVVLSFGLPFAVLPLLYFTSRRRFLGVMANRPVTVAFGMAAAGVIVGLNIFLLFRLLFGG